MGLLRRLLGDRGGPGAHQAAVADGDASGVDDDELARDRELLREEARRLDDALLQRQLRYADRSWRPPSQGGEVRAADGDDRRD